MTHLRARRDLGTGSATLTLIAVFGLLLSAPRSSFAQMTYDVQITPGKSQLASILLTSGSVHFDKDDRIIFDPAQPDARFEPPTLEYGGLRGTIELDASLRTLGPRIFKVIDGDNGHVKMTGTVMLTAPEPRITSVSVIKGGELSDTLVIERGETFDGFLVIEGSGFYPGCEVKLLGDGFKLDTHPDPGDVSNDRIRTSLSLDNNYDIRAGRYVVTVSHGHHPTAIGQLTVTRRENSLRRYALTIGSTFDFVDGVKTGSFYYDFQAYLPDLWVWGPSTQPFSSVGLAFALQQGKSFSYDSSIVLRDPRQVRYDTTIAPSFANGADTTVVRTSTTLADTSRVSKALMPVRLTASVFLPMRQWIDLVAGFDYRRVEVTETVTDIIESRKVIGGTGVAEVLPARTQTTTRIVDDPSIWAGFFFPVDDYPAKGLDLRLRVVGGYGWSFLDQSHFNWEIMWSVLVETGDIEIGGYLRGRSSQRPELMAYLGKQFDVVKIADLFD